MKNLFALALSAVGLFGVLTVPQAKADEWNKKTIFTFSGPVEIPGQVLPAGTYVFKLENSQSDRHIVQVYNKNESHLYATLLAIPDYRMRPTGKTIITFEERAAGAPEAVKAWFYPGDNYGDQFVYPKTRAVQLAKQNNNPVPSMNNDMEQNTKQSSQNSNQSMTAMKQTPLKAQRPTGEETEITEVYVAPPQNQNQNASQNQNQNQNQNAQADQSSSAGQSSNNAPTQMAQNNMPRHLPKTASNLPLIALSGLFALALAFSLGLVSRRLS